MSYKTMQLGQKTLSYYLDKDLLLHNEGSWALWIHQKDISDCYYYYHHGILYRKNGPAIEYSNYYSEDFFTLNILNKKEERLKPLNEQKEMYHLYYHQILSLKEKALLLGEKRLINYLIYNTDADFRFKDKIILNSPSHHEEGQEAVNQKNRCPKGSKKSCQIFHYYKNGMLHREDGPAVIRKEKESNKEEIAITSWYLEGKIL